MMQNRCIVCNLASGYHTGSGQYVLSRLLYLVKFKTSSLDERRQQRKSNIEVYYKVKAKISITIFPKHKIKILEDVSETLNLFNLLNLNVSFVK